MQDVKRLSARPLDFFDRQLVYMVDNIRSFLFIHLTVIFTREYQCFFIYLIDNAMNYFNLNRGFFTGH